jgi:hypothetical protein
MCLSMRMRRFSGLQMRMNERVREGADYYSFLSHRLVSEGILCTVSMIFVFRFYFIILVLVHSLLFSAFFVIKLL